MFFIQFCTNKEMKKKKKKMSVQHILSKIHLRGMNISERLSVTFLKADNL